MARNRKMIAMTNTLFEIYELGSWKVEKTPTLAPMTQANPKIPKATTNVSKKRGLKSGVSVAFGEVGIAKWTHFLPPNPQ